MESSCPVNRPFAVLQILLFAVVFSSVTSENSPWCSVKSRSPGITCDVNLTRCDSRVLTLSLFAPPVNNLQVSVEMLQDKASDQYLLSLATMHWNLPDRCESLIGFLVHLQTSDASSDECYLVSIPWTALKDNPEFDFYLPLEPNNYTVRVHSYVESSLVHGSPYTVPRRTIIVKKRKKELRNIPALWITDLVLCSNSCSKSITISFELAPDAYNFNAYTVFLVQGSVRFRAKLNVVNGQRQGTVVFGNVTSGNYTIEMSPENTDWKDSNLCRCRCGASTAFYCRGKSCPDFGCIAIVSNVVTIDNVNATDCLLTTDDPLLPTKVTGIAIGCFLATGLIALFVWILVRPKHIDIDIHLLEKQEVLLLYLTDHQHHCRVVHNLLHFLNRHCNCSVRTMRDDEHLISQNLYTYIENVCGGSSKILLINSDGIANGSQSVSSNPLDPMVRMFLEYLRPKGIDGNENHKLMIARFDYTEINNTAKHINYRQHEYLLMQEVELLILRIHGFEKRKGRCVYHMRDIQKRCNDSPEGKRLGEAVSLMKGFMVDKCDWQFSVGSQVEQSRVNECDWQFSFGSQVEESFVSDFTGGEQQFDSGYACEPIAYDDVWELSAESIGEVDVRERAVEIYGREPAVDIYNREPVIDTYDREPAGEFYVSEQSDTVELLRVQLIPPSSDSSSLDSDGEMQHWRSELNMDFDSYNSQSTGWTT